MLLNVAIEIRIIVRLSIRIKCIIDKTVLVIWITVRMLLFFFFARIIADCLTRELSQQQPIGDPERRRRQLTEMWRQDIRYIHAYLLYVAMQLHSSYQRCIFYVLSMYIQFTTNTALSIHNRYV